MRRSNVLRLPLHVVFPDQIHTQTLETRPSFKHMRALRFQHRLLRVPDLIPELVESNLGDVDAVDEDGTFRGFHDPEESEH